MTRLWGDFVYEAGCAAAFQKLGMASPAMAARRLAGNRKLMAGAGAVVKQVADPILAVGQAFKDTAGGVRRFFNADTRAMLTAAPGQFARQVAAPAANQGVRDLAIKYGPRIEKGINTWAMPG